MILCQPIVIRNIFFDIKKQYFWSLLREEKLLSINCIKNQVAFEDRGNTKEITYAFKNLTKHRFEEISLIFREANLKLTKISV